MTAVEDTTGAAGPTPAHKRKIVRTLILASLGVVGYAQNDLRKRSAAEVHGPKLLWKLACTNSLLAIVYLRHGRKPAA